MSFRRRFLVAISIIVTSAVTALLTFAIAEEGTITKFRAGKLTQVRAVSQEDNTGESKFTQADEFVDLPGAKTTVGGEGNAFLVATFSGASSCSGNPADACEVRILLDGEPMHPRGLSIFDGVPDSGGYDGAESLSLQKFANVGGGTHTVKVQWKACCGDNLMSLRGWTLTVMRFRR